MSRRDPAYTPMCNRLLRFYLSNPERTSFNDSLSELQFMATKTAFEKLPSQWQERFTSILPEAGTHDLLDSYIKDRLIASGAKQPELNAFYNQLRLLNREIAISLGYISATPNNNTNGGN